MAGQEKKVAVLDPLTLRNTVGAELAEMLEAHGVEHAEALLGVKGLRGRERLPEGGMRKASALLGIPVEEYLARFQASYLQEKPRYRAGYAGRSPTPSICTRGSAGASWTSGRSPCPPTMGTRCWAG